MDVGYYLARLSFGKAVRQRSWKKLAAQTRHGLSLEGSLRQMYQRAEAQGSPLGRVWLDVLQQMDAGHSLGVALASFVPVDEIMLISSGQQSGQLPEGLDLAVRLLDARRKITSAVVGAVAMPLLLFVLSLALLVFVAVYFVPDLAQLSDPDTWVDSARTLHLFSAALATPPGLGICVLLGLSPVGLLAALPLWTGPLRTRLDKYPPFSLYRLTVGSVWLFSLATLMRAGRPIGTVLDAMLDMRLSPWLRERIQAVREVYEGGKGLGEALHETRLGFPDPEIIDDLRVYATLPGFDDQLYALASDWMRDGVEYIEQQAAVLKTLCYILISLLIGWIVIGMNSIQNQLMSGMGGF